MYKFQMHMNKVFDEMKWNEIKQQQIEWDKRFIYDCISLFTCLYIVGIIFVCTICNQSFILFILIYFIANRTSEMCPIKSTDFR